MTAHRCAGGLKKKFDLPSDSNAIQHFVGFFNTRPRPFDGYSKNLSDFSRLLRHACTKGCSKYEVRKNNAKFWNSVGLDTLNICKSKMERSQVSRGVIIPCRYAIPFASALWTPPFELIETYFISIMLKWDWAKVTQHYLCPLPTNLDIVNKMSQWRYNNGIDVDMYRIKTPPFICLKIRVSNKVMISS